ncbi:MAG: xanthine dehydrogenase family protein subunit M [Methylocystaceae bacterium]|nr:xanthine dehydrogenase family protein subunit M [Methylocystaceae bacterium]
MIPGKFEYYRPGSLNEAVALLSKLGEDARPLAGGHSLIPLMKTRLATPEHLIDLSGIAGLKAIEHEGNALKIGAMASQFELIHSDLIARHIPIIPETSLLIADPQIRYKGTIGGNVANGDPGNDMPALMQCLDANYDVIGPGGARSISARSFYNGAYDTALKSGEIVTSIRIPIPPIGHGYAYEKLKRKIGDYATAAAAVVITMSNGHCQTASIGLTNLSETPLWAEEAGKHLVGSTLDSASVSLAVAAAESIVDPASDMRGPAEYRRKMAGVMLRRAIERAKSRAKA